MSFIIKIRIILWSILVVVVVWLFYMAIVPSGKITYRATAGKDNYFIGKLTPAERLRDDQDGKVIIGDPVYFFLRTPRRFEKARLTVKYKITINEAKLPIGSLASVGVVPIIEAGILTDKKIWQYDLRPMENSVLDGLREKWNMIKEGEIMLLQKNKKYNTIDDFLKSPPPLNKIAVYNYDFKTEFLLKDYKAVEGIEISEPLRGAYQFYTYLKNEDFDFDFSFFDLNKNKDSDEADLYLYYNDQIIDSRHLADDGNIADNGQTSDLKKIKFHISNLPEGVYRMAIKANNDIITKEIKTKQSKLSFINKVWLSGDDGGNITLLTDSKEIKAQTINPARLQTIKVGSDQLDLNETYRQFSLKTNEKISAIKLAKDDVILAGDGVFSFATSSLINPAFKKVDNNFSVGDTEFIIANYQVPKMENGWLVAQAEFDLTRAYSEKNKFSFLISIPGLKADDAIGEGIVIKEIIVDLEGKSLGKFLRKFIK